MNNVREGRRDWKTKNEAGVIRRAHETAKPTRPQPSAALMVSPRDLYCGCRELNITSTQATLEPT